ncbi:MAG: hypothetical protein NTX49_07610 [Chlamydiae bacterium]|nr:hypothetical protein [Chlamydiota bacterium]
MLKKILLACLWLQSSFAGSFSSPLLNEDGYLIEPLVQIAKLYDVDPPDQLGSLVAFSQKYWIQGKERWEFSKEDNSPVVLQVMQDLGCIAEVHAKEKVYTYALLLGSTEKNMKERISFLISEWENGVNFSHVVLLSGERPLDPKIEPMAASFTTESALLKHLWQSMVPEQMQSIPYSLVNSAMKSGGKRPTTGDTVIDWLKERPSPGHCIAISSQPYIGYQHSVLQILSPTFTVETIGPKRQGPLPLALSLDTLAKWMYQEKIRLNKENFP